MTGAAVQAEAEVGGFGAEISLGIGRLAEQMAKLDRRIDDLRDAMSSRVAFASGTQTTSTSVTTTLVIPTTVPLGRIWSLLMLSVAPAPVTTSVSCSVWLFVGSPAGGAVPAQYVDSVGGQIPVSWGPKGPHDLPIRGGDQLYLVLGTTAGAGVQVTANARFHDMPDMG